MENKLGLQNVQNYSYNPAIYNNMSMPAAPLTQIPMAMNMGMPNAIMPMMPINNYSNDLFAPDFIKNPNNNIWQGYNTQNYTQNTQNQSIFNSVQNTNPTPQQPQTQTFTGETNPKQENTIPEENNNVSEKTNLFKKLGTTVGLSVPLLTAGYKMIQGAKFSDVVKFKELGLKGTALALAGWCAGAIIDGIINRYNSQKEQKTA